MFLNAVEGTAFGTWSLWVLILITAQAKIIQSAVKVTCMVIFVSLLYDVLTCNRFHKTHTYKYIQRFVSTKTGRMFVRRIKKAKKKYLKATLWPSFRNGDEFGHQLEPYLNFINNWSAIRNYTVSFIQDVKLYLGKNFTGFLPPMVPLFENLVNLAKTGKELAFQHLHKYMLSVLDYIRKML